MSSLPPPENADWRPTAPLENLRRRATILRRIREFFDSAGFFEVQTPCLSNETVVDQHLDPVTVHRDALRGTPTLAVPAGGDESHPQDPAGAPHKGPADASPWLYLQTSPEAAMKRLLAAGASAIYQLGPVFRSDERGPLHNPEFTMLEWYRTGDSMLSGIDCLRGLISHVLGGPLPEVITYQMLFEQSLGFDPFTISDTDLLQRVAQSDTGYHPSGQENRDTCLDLLMGLVVAPALRGRVVVCNYPISQAALARPSDTDPRTAERFELFIDGVEIANGYAELLDAEVLWDRTDNSNRLREADRRGRLPPPRRLLSAMRSGLPSCSGTAVGVDRLVMAALGASSIDQVIPFPIDLA